MLEEIGSGLDWPHEKIRAARQILEAAPGDDPVFRQTIIKLDRLAVELARIEAGIAVREGLTG